MHTKNRHRAQVRVWIGALAITATTLWTHVAFATNRTWTGVAGDQKWSSPANWLPAGVPGAADTASINGSNVVKITGNHTIKNLRLGKDATLANSGRLTVTGWTSSDGLVAGTGEMNVPAGATANYELKADTLASTLRRAARGGVCANSTLHFGKIRNKGQLNVKVASLVNVAFQDITNDGGQINLSTTSTRVRPFSTVVCRPSSAPVVFQSLHNKNGKVTLSGTGATGRAFFGSSIDNQAEFVFDSANAVLREGYINHTGATVTFKGDSVVSGASTLSRAQKFQNAGLVHQIAGETQVRLAWNNAGRLVVDGGTLRLAPPQGEAVVQTAGCTTLNDATLEVGDASDEQFVMKGGILNGSGTIKGDLRNESGRVQIGHSPGLMVINGNYTQTANGILDMEVWGTRPGFDYDQMQVEGNVYLNGTMNLIRGNNFVPGGGNLFTHITYTTRYGAFSTINVVNPVAGLSYITEYTGEEFTSTAFIATPTVAITAPAQNANATNLTTLAGTATGGPGGTLANVKLSLYRYANDRVGAGYWAGGTSWTSSLTTPPAANLSGTNWSLPIANLQPARYLLRATATNTAGNSTTSTDVAFWLTIGPSSINCSSTTASAATSSASLTFSAALDSITATDLSRYSAKVGGVPVAVQSATLTSGNVVKLQLPAGSVATGQTVSITYTGLFGPMGGILNATTSAVA